MGPLCLTLAVLLGAQTSDTLPPFQNPATRALVGRAMARHRSQDTLVHDYQARLTYRLSLAMGKRQWALLPTMAVEEQRGRVQWQEPNDIRIEIDGRRAKARSDEFNLSSMFDHPWFIPRGLGDSVRIFGSDFPTRAALHPLAADGPEWYHYDLTDSVTVYDPDHGPVKIYSVAVTPRRVGPSLVAGRIGLDAETAEVVRFTFRYVGTQLWVGPDEEEDSTSARRLNSLVNRILTVDADLEYSLQDGRYWMPWRQVLAGEVRVPVVDAVVPFRVITTFDDYRVNTGRPVAFRLPRDTVSGQSGRISERDSTGARDIAGTWHHGHYEIHRAPRDSLRTFSNWDDSLRLELSPAEDRQVREMVTQLADLSESLPDELTGRRRFGLAYRRLADVFRYNRVQGLSFGVGYKWTVPGVDFTTLQGTLRFGLSDSRILGRLSAVRDGPGGRWRLSGYRDLAEVEDVRHGQAPGNPVDALLAGGDIGNTLNALFVAHDNADYYLAQGGSLEYQTSPARGLDLTLSLLAEHQSSVRAEARSAVNDFLGGDGRFPPNPPIVTGDFLGAGVRLDGELRRARWTLMSDALTGEGRTMGRVEGQWRQAIGGDRGLSLGLRAGIGTSPVLPQRAFRAGGLRSVRGFDYGARSGQAFWAAQADYTPWKSWGVRPVLFLDAGQAGRPSQLFNTEPLVGGGVGLSFLRGLSRLDFSFPLAGPGQGMRFDLVFLAPR